MYYFLRNATKIKDKATKIKNKATKIKDRATKIKDKATKIKDKATKINEISFYSKIDCFEDKDFNRGEYACRSRL